jgi:uncharacterized membrane protein YccC
MSATGTGPRAWLAGHGPELRLTIRVVVAGVATFVIAELLGLQQGFWAVITAVIVMQASVGGSLKASLDRLIGTVAGAVFGGAIALLVPSDGLEALGMALAVALTPLALLAALYPSFRVAPITAVIVLLTPVAGSMGPLTFTVDRIAEIALGCMVGLAVSLVILPARAHGLIASSAARILGQLSALLPLTLSGLQHKLDMTEILAGQARIRAALAQIEALVGEARGERAGHLTDEPDPGPLMRTLMRLRNDLVILIRAADDPMPDMIYQRLAPAIVRLSSAGTTALDEAATALAARKPPSGVGAFAEALAAYGGEIAGMRRDGLTRDLSGEDVGRLFAVGFALEQMRRDLEDLNQRILEFARPAAVASAS